MPSLCQVPGCGAVLGQHNPFFYRLDGIRKCIPHRQAAWTPEPTPGNAAPPMRERATVTHKQRHDKVSKALPVTKVCPCESPIPTDDEDDTCFRCNKRIPVAA